MACSCRDERTKRVIEDVNFRELYRRFQYIDCPEEMESLRGEIPMLPDADGIVTYCFIEEGLGLTFLILCSAKLGADGELIMGPSALESLPRVRFADVFAYAFCDQDEFETVDWSEYEYLKDEMNEKFETKDRIRRMVYDLEMIDGSRNVECPEYVSVVVQKEGLYPEYVWAKCVGFGEKEIYGELLEPPKQAGYGLKTNQRITFQMYDYDDKIYLIWIPD